MKGILVLLILVSLFIFGVDKPNVGGSTNWGSTGWGGEVRSGLGMRTPVGGGITEYYVPNVGWV